MLLDKGIATICELINVAEEGNKPKQMLTPIAQQWYGERAVGYNRQYAARAVNEQVDMLIRIWAEDVRPRIGRYILLDDGSQFQIRTVTYTVDEDQLPVYDIALSALEEDYDVIRKAENSSRYTLDV